MRLLAGAEEALAGEAPEGRPEVDAVEGVDERIDGAVEPSQPGQSLGQHVAGLVLGQEGGDQIVDEEGQPAGDEAAHHDAQRLRRLVLLLQRRNPVGQRLAVAGVAASSCSCSGTRVPAGRCCGHPALVVIVRMMVVAPRVPEAVRAGRLTLPLGVQETAARPDATCHCGNGRRGRGCALQRGRSRELVAPVLATPAAAAAAMAARCSAGGQRQQRLTVGACGGGPSPACSSSSWWRRRRSTVVAVAQHHVVQLLGYRLVGEGARCGLPLPLAHRAVLLLLRQLVLHVRRRVALEFLDTQSAQGG